MQDRYMNILSINLTIWTKKLSLRRMQTDHWFYSEAIIVSEKNIFIAVIVQFPGHCELFSILIYRKYNSQNK